jgi:TatD DNase family protein
VGRVRQSMFVGPDHLGDGESECGLQEERKVRQAHGLAPYLTPLRTATTSMPTQLVDIGLNLGHRRFDSDRDEVVQRALEAGVTKMILTGTDVAESEAMVSLAASRPGVFWSTAGVHPHDAATCDDETLPSLRRLAQNPAVVAIGECGLDFNRDFSPRPLQELWFSQQITLARDLDLPLFLHERDATARLLALLDRAGEPCPRGVVHCFTGDRAALEAYLERGLYVGVTGWICDERRGLGLQEIVRHIPLERLLVETDSPYLPPRDLRPRPKRNEPAHLPHIVATIARHMSASPEEVARSSSRNATHLFGLTPPLRST